MKMLVVLCCTLAMGQSKSAQDAYERANLLFSKQQFQESLAAVEQALRLDANLVPALTLRAKLAMAAKRNDLARVDLERAVAVDPQSAYAQFLLGFVLYELNELQLASKPLERALKLNAKDARAALYLGLTKESLGEPDGALALYNESMRLEETVETYLIAARLNMVLDRLDEAERLVQKALRRDAGSRDARFESARIAARRGHYDAAVKDAARALAASGGEITSAQIHALLARCYQALGDTEKAARHARLVQ